MHRAALVDTHMQNTVDDPAAAGEVALKHILVYSRLVADEVAAAGVAAGVGGGGGAGQSLHPSATAVTSATAATAVTSATAGVRVQAAGQVVDGVVASPAT